MTSSRRVTPEAQELYLRQVEVFAAYVTYNDYEIGRVIQAFEDLGKLDNTLSSTRTATTGIAIRRLIRGLLCQRHDERNDATNRMPRFRMIAFKDRAKNGPGVGTPRPFVSELPAGRDWGSDKPTEGSLHSR